MIEAPKPVNEQLRLQQLKNLNILDTPIEERFERITRMVCRSLGVPISAISLIDNDRQWFKSVQGLNVNETPRNISFCGHAIMEDTPFIISNALEDERFHDNPLVSEAPSIRFYAGIPITIADNIRIGTLCAIDSKPKVLTPEELEVLKDLCEILKNEILYMESRNQSILMSKELEEAKRAALVDPLTKLWNRDGTRRALDREFEIAKREGKWLAVCLLDVDHFKSINDTYGHKIGDRCLRDVSKIAVEALRPSDTMGRWGGEEFLIVISNCARVKLSNILERLLTRFRSHLIKDTEQPIKFTASVGAFLDNPKDVDMDIEGFIERADKALYEAKAGGRDRFVVYQKS